MSLFTPPERFRAPVIRGRPEEFPTKLAGECGWNRRGGNGEPSGRALSGRLSVSTMPRLPRRFQH